MIYDTEKIPGTVHLVDNNGDMHAEHSEGAKDVVLVPTPTDDPDDPLNWSFRRKMLCMFCLILYNLAIGIPASAIYSVLTPIIENTNLTLSNLNNGTGVMFLFFGWGCLLWQPMAQQYGKRPVYIFSVFVYIFLMVWAPYTTSSGEWIASKLLQGFFGAPAESLGEITIADIWFEHERGRWMSVYALSLFVSNSIAPLVAGFISDGQSWKWVCFWCSIFDAAAVIFLFFFFEETNYIRQHISPDDEIEEAPMEKQAGIVTVEQSDSNPEPVKRFIDMTKPKKTYMQKLKFFDKPRPFVIHKLMWRSLTMFRFPGVCWAGFYYGLSVVWNNILNGTSSTVLSAAPYNFSASMVGLTYIAPIVGNVIFTYCSGNLGDRLRLYIARRRNGISEPEDRLWTAIIYLMVCPGGFILWGVGAWAGIPWIGIVIGMGIVSGSGIMGCHCGVNYVLESYGELGSCALVPVIIIRNTMSFGVSWGITPWFENQGLKKMYIAACFISLAGIATFIPMLYYGKKTRVATKHAYWKYVQEASDLGLPH
ncbi:unnamed protein product [Kuraishia capsulata CBS 1993]|uniref:Major facilitator superfamily (MFS) profile domain-containing protein n=1 Tax=Kuraishia capsulata CBS 1993 TaxID=1382522 RepID=W6MS19_9ASCO|nr:uncharacterized protein KUCA_T00005482001 [Kuraishia capsulata CBS 1993]CDK29494.1 unnamed protein product [Kuraishia capsulata CBS 1993]